MPIPESKNQVCSGNNVQIPYQGGFFAVSCVVRQYFQIRNVMFFCISFCTQVYSPGAARYDLLRLRRKIQFQIIDEQRA